MGSPGGYMINPGLYRVPDLLTEDQFVRYMKNTYGRTIEFTDEETHSPARALGKSAPQGALDEEDQDKLVPSKINDPVLRSLNERNFDTPGVDTVVKEDEETKVEKKTESTPSTTSSTTTKRTTSK